MGGTMGNTKLTAFVHVWKRGLLTALEAFCVFDEKKENASTVEISKR